MDEKKEFNMISIKDLYWSTGFLEGKGTFIASYTNGGKSLALTTMELLKITITRSIASEGEVRQVIDVFVAAKWDLASKGAEQTWEEFKLNLSKIRK